jgi:hypothetical protein
VCELWFSIVTITEMVEDKKNVDPTLAGFYEAMERTNVEKITNEILTGLSGDSSDSDSFDIESENENAEDRLWRLLGVYVVAEDSKEREHLRKILSGASTEAITYRASA